jgi:glycosyltransferase involved in cell wall biosynthesis
VIGPLNQLTERLEQVAVEADHQVNLRFADYVADSTAAMRQINVLMSLSVVPESFGRTIAEAMSAGRPVIAYRAGAPPEFVRHGVDGFLVPHMQFADALDHLAALADSPSLLRQMGQKGRERALQLFSPAVFARQLNAAYAEILAERKTRHGPRP